MNLAKNSKDVKKRMTQLLLYNHTELFINTLIDRVIEDVFSSKGLTVRQEQLNVIKRAIFSILNGKNNIIIEAPTGTGKSYIAYSIIEILRRLHSINKTKLTSRDFNFSKNTDIPLEDLENVTFSGTIVTATIPLQEQYINDFPFVSNIMSARNYPCDIMLDNNTKEIEELLEKDSNNRTVYFGTDICKTLCKTGVCNIFCKYKLAKIQFKYADFRLTNNAYYIKEEKLTDTITTFDECHKLADSLMNTSTNDIRLDLLDKFIEAITTDKSWENEQLIDVKKLLLEQLINIQTGLESLYESIKVCKSNDDSIRFDNTDIKDLINGEVSAILNIMKDCVENINKIKKFLDDSFELALNTLIKDENIKDNIVELILKESRKRKYPKYLNSMIETLDDYSNKFNLLYNHDSNHTLIVKSMTDKSVDIIPNIPKTFSNNMLFNKIGIRVFMSATVCGVNEFCNELGLNIADTEFISTDSPFLPETRPLFIENVISFNNKNKDEALDLIINKLMRDINTKYQDVRGIIHTVSFSNAEYILDKINRLDKMLRYRFIYTQSFREFYSLLTSGMVSDDSIFIGPNLIEGLDFKDDLARFQYIIKLPYQFLGDKVIKYNMENIPNHYARNMIRALIQAYGRGVRNKNDYCDTFVLDSNINRYLNSELIPHWVRNAIIKI